MINLKDIGFYTLSNERAATASPSSPLQRAEIVLSARCNFSCPYCRHVGGPDLPMKDAMETLELWARQGLKAVRFSGGEPTLYPGILHLVQYAKDLGIERIAISTNGSADPKVYWNLIWHGVNDFSISLDACCAADGNKMAGHDPYAGTFNRVVSNIKWISRRVYTTVGVVLTKDNAEKIDEIIRFADSLGVSDIRVIPAAQEGETLPVIQVDEDLLQKYPILRYRHDNLKHGRPVRGIRSCDSKRCGLVLDDVAVCQNKHYPCIIYLRERGKPIGPVGPEMRLMRYAWYQSHNTHLDPICQKNCLDVCVEYNNTFNTFNPEAKYQTPGEKVLRIMEEVSRNDRSRKEPSDVGAQSEQRCGEVAC